MRKGWRNPPLNYNISKLGIKFVTCARYNIVYMVTLDTQTTDLDVRMWCVNQVLSTDSSIDFEKIEKLYDFVSKGLAKQEG